MTTQLDVLIAAALEREQMAIRAAQEQRRREDEQLAAQWRTDLLELLDAALSNELRDLLDLTIQTTRAGAWAEFTYADRRFNLQRGGGGGDARDILVLKQPGDSYLVQIGHVSPSIGHLDEGLLRSLGHWRENQSAESLGEDDPTLDPPF